jgi:hypothetical protein
MAVDPVSGDIGVLYIDSRNYEDNILSEAYVSYSSDAGETWIDRRVSDIGSDLRKNPFLGGAFAGDYNGCAFYDGVIYPSWVDMRNALQQISDNDVFTALIHTQVPEPVNNLSVKHFADKPKELEISWKHNNQTTFGKSLPKRDITFKLYRNGLFAADIPAENYVYSDKNLEPFKKNVYSVMAIYKGDSSVRAEAFGYPGGAYNPSSPVLTEIKRLDGNEVEIRLELPSLRADKVTPLINLSGLKLFRDTTLAQSLELTSDMAGKRITIKDTVPVKGSPYCQYFTNFFNC